MPSISYDAFVPWVNYHLTMGTINSPDLEPRVEVEDMGRFHAADLMDTDGIERFAATAAQLWKHIARVWFLMDRKRKLNDLGDPPRPFPAALVGRGWSFSNIIGADRGKKRESMLLCDGLAGSIMIPRGDLAVEVLEGHVALTGGGTRFRELLDWAATRHGRSVMTSGTHLGATVAGAIATATHGSRLGYGGMQNMIMGLHIVTGLNESVWIERRREPVLTGAAADKLNVPGAGFRVIRDDDMFEDALVHLGCMGIVNCAAIRLVDDKAFEVLRRDKPVDDQWLQWVAAGDWGRIAEWLGDPRIPIFYEATLDPHGWNKGSALHTLYFEAASPPGANPLKSLPTVGDSIVRLGDIFSVAKSVELDRSKLAKLPDLDRDFLSEADRERFFAAPRGRARPADMRVFDPASQAQSAFDYYRITGGFSEAGTMTGAQSWRQIHGDEITGGYPGSLYNASYAIDRGQVSAAIPAISAAVKSLPMSFVFTLRFVSNPAGTLAFTRFSENCVIEIDGLSPWICRRTRRYLVKGSPTYWKDKRMLDYLEDALPDGAHRLKHALNRAKVDFSNHFGKRSFLERRKIKRDFGPRIERWRRTREALLATPLGRAIFWNWGAVNFGLIEQPRTMPPPFPDPGGE